MTEQPRDGGSQESRAIGTQTRSWLIAITSLGVGLGVSFSHSPELGAIAFGVLFVLMVWVIPSVLSGGIPNVE